MIFTITRIRTPKDGRGSTQNRVRIANSQPKNEHGCTFFGVPAGVFCTLLASASPIFKSVGGRGIYCVPLLQILNVSERPRTGVVPRRIEFALPNSQPKNEHGCTFFGVPAVNFCSRLVSVPSLCKKANGERLFRTDRDVRGSKQK